MGFDHTLLSKNTSNSHLLTLLTRRQAKSLTNIRSDWPGKHAPSLVNFFPNKKTQNKVGTNFTTTKQEEIEKNRKMFTKTSQAKFRHTAPISLIKENSRSISLKPSPRTDSRTMNSSWKTTHGGKKFY